MLCHPRTVVLTHGALVPHARAHLALSGNISGCHKVGRRKVLLTSLELRPAMLRRCPRGHRTAPPTHNKGLSTPNVNAAEPEKPCF